MLVVAISFALLQPFLHVHLDTGHPVQQTGFHIANSHEAVHNNAAHNNEHRLTGTSHTSEVISIDAAVKQDTNFELSIDLVFLALIIFCTGLYKGSTSTPREYSQENLYRSSTRQIPAQRAPPQH